MHDRASYPRRWEKLLLMVGIFMIGLGVVCNRWLVTAVVLNEDLLQSSYRLIATAYRLIWTVLKKLYLDNGMLSSESFTLMWVISLGLVLGGLTMVVFRRRVLFDIAAGLFFSVVIFLAIEAVFSFLKDDISREGDFFSEFRQVDADLGYKPLPGRTVSAAYTVNGHLAYDVTYTVDEYGRRVTAPLCPGEQDRFILFYGGSFTFGDGVEDDQTLPYYVSQRVPQTHVYNYGFSGYGTHHLLALLEREAMGDEVAESTGALVYVYIDHHVNRAIGSMNAYAWGQDTPRYVIGTDGSLKREGTFRSAATLLPFVYFVLEKSQTIKYIQPDFPRIREAHIALTARIMEASRDRFRERFGSDDFYVLIYPGSKFKDVLIPYLEKAGVAYLDYANLFELTDPTYHIVGDGHPNANAHQIIAEKLVADLGFGPNAVSGETFLSLCK